jgi:DNA polymerase-3 subunit delta'
MQFSKVAGHAALKQKLIQAAREGRIPHAQLFTGPGGNGKLALAVAYATFLSCEDRKDTDSCGQCSSCIKYGKLSHPDLHFVLPVNTTRSVSREPVTDDFMEEWRTAFLEQPYITTAQWYQAIGIENKQGFIGTRESDKITYKLNLKSYESRYKIMVIWMPEKMNKTASNKLLKLIEEPPPDTVLLMVGDDPDSLLPTVLSRTQQIRVPAIQDQDLREALASMQQYDALEIENAVKLACGNYNKALDYLRESEENLAHLELFIRIMRLAYSRDLQEIFTWVEELSAIGRERQKAFLGFAIRMVRENLLLNEGQEDLARLTKSERDFSEKFHTYIHQGNAPLIAGELNQAIIHIESNAYARIVFLDFALKLVKMIR